MVVTKLTTDPYIASRNYSESTTGKIVFEGTKKECEEFLLDEFNKHFDTYAESVSEALRWTDKRGCYDGLYRLPYKGKNLYMNWDSRHWEIKHKKDVEE